MYQCQRPTMGFPLRNNKTLPNINVNRSHHPRLHQPSPFMPFANASKFRDLSTRNDGEILKYLLFAHGGRNWRPPQETITTATFSPPRAHLVRNGSIRV